jgi:uncharacterized protein YfaP (DUF2135 family)
MTMTGRCRVSRVLAPIVVGVVCLFAVDRDVCAQSPSRVETGTLSSTDSKLDNGEFYDRFSIEGRRGQLFTIDLRSSDFDTFLQLHATDEFGEINDDQPWFNDDFENDKSHSRLEVELPADGTYVILVTSYEAGETGRYELAISTSRGRVETGKLGGKDSRLDNGEFYDVYRINASAGETYVIDLFSDDFDTYLMVRNPDDPDFSLDNDDHDSDRNRSQVVMQTPADGVYDVYVTSFGANETGAYRLTISEPATTTGGSVRHEAGELAEGDGTLDSGEFFDRFTVTLEEGDTIDINLASTDFDAYLFVRHADDADFQLDNDDREEGVSDSHIAMTAPHRGVYEVYVTSYKAGETGSYRLTISGAGAAGDQVREETGALANGDDRLDGGEFADRYELNATAGEPFTIDLYSEDFDTYLFVRSDDDSKFELDNDDFDGSMNHSQVRMTAQVTGTYFVFVTSFGAGETGDYRLTIRSGNASDLAGPTTRRESGRLDRDDGTLDTGEYRDVYEFEGRPGQHVRIELRSGDFDTYLILQDPSGDTQDNDDFDNRRDMSVIELDLTEAGTYRVAVTSYKKGETGAYELLMEFDQAPPGVSGRDRVQLDGSGTHPGSLGDGDELDDGRYADRYSVSLTAGQRAVIRMESDDFDSLMILTYPDGTEVEFDDELSSRNAAIDLIPEASGEYSVTATSYSPDAKGDYELDVTLDAPGRPVGHRGNIPVTADRRILGVFVGISDYEGDDNDLEFCDHDAQLLYGIMQREFEMRPDDSALVVNADATLDTVAAALRRIGERARPNDLLLFFYSGHGDQVAGPEDVFDPDGIHETLSLYDGEMQDDDVAALINGSPAGIALVAIDSCFSGGFAKDVVSARGRMGVFSSEEDVLSVVPEKFRAGGYLSRFLAEAVSERRHDSDRNGDGDLTAHELSHYLAERYLQEVRSTKEKHKSDDEFVNPDDDLSFQRLVVDRGGLSHDQVLFSWK